MNALSAWLFLEMYCNEVNGNHPSRYNIYLTKTRTNNNAVGALSCSFAITWMWPCQVFQRRTPRGDRSSSIRNRERAAEAAQPLSLYLWPSELMRHNTETSRVVAPSEKCVGQAARPETSLYHTCIEQRGFWFSGLILARCRMELKTMTEVFCHQRQEQQTRFKILLNALQLVVKAEASCLTLRVCSWVHGKPWKFCNRMCSMT